MPVQGSSSETALSSSPDCPEQGPPAQGGGTVSVKDVVGVMVAVVSVPVGAGGAVTVAVGVVV